MLRSKGGIYVPPSAQGVELRKQFTCLICGQGFHDGEAEAYSRHVARCARQNEGELREMSPRERVPEVFGDEGKDVEYSDWVHEHGRLG